MKHYNRYYFLFALCVCIFLHSQAQTISKINHDLRFYLSQVNDDDLVPLLIEGEAEFIRQTIAEKNGRIRLALPPFYSIDIPASQVEAFCNHPSINAVDFSLTPGKALNDTMLIQTRTDLVHQLQSPIREEYTGKNVLLGVIDSGIEWQHGDFKDSTGKTRILHIWDQGVAYNPQYQPSNYFYGIEWDSTHINNLQCTHDDKASENGHGSNVTGIAASNGNATGQFKGIAPDVHIVSVATDFIKPNWLQTVVEATDYIFKKADSLGIPAVVNASIGTYIGSHDGLDIAARMIDLLIKQKSGRAFVCAAGNAAQFPFHLRHSPNNDTLFTWFENHPQMFSGLGGVYFEAWSDTADFNQMQFSIGADRATANSFEFRGRTAFAQAKNRVNQLFADSIMSFSGNKLADITTFVSESQGRYKLEVAIVNPDSGQYRFRFESTGVGDVDIWSSFALLRHSTITYSNLPTISQWPEMSKYVRPDTLQTMVSSFTCLPSVITVGNYVNRSTYTDVRGIFNQVGVTPGQISQNSSLGPNRLGYLKPDISSAGDYTFSAGRLATIQFAMNSNPSKVSQDSLHYRNGGTSMASPTVAGMVALLLEKCGQLDYQQIKAKIIASARTDNFTQNLPNPQWGYGKANAYQLISNEVFSSSLSQNSAQICENDSFMVSAPINLSSYLWNTHDTTQSISVDSSGTYFAQVWNSNGCRDRTDSLILTVHPLPLKPSISQIGDTLFTNANGQIQWYYNQFPIPSANSNKLYISQLGHYFVKTTTLQNCSNNSDTLHVQTVGLESNAKVKTSIFPNPAKDFVTIRTDTPLEQIRILELNGKVLFDKTFIANEQFFQIPLSQFENGYYILELIGNETYLQNPLIIIR